MRAAGASGRRESGPPRFDESRLRDALAQLAMGVRRAPPVAGKLHRDIKPTNVMVTQSGRVVLLDFGLTVDLEPSAQQPTADRQVVGTLAPHVARAGARPDGLGRQRLVQRRRDSLPGPDRPPAVRWRLR